ncbi:MAG: SLC13 family permease [Ilumatobacteraceae bacterium]|nr:SLC13 family permease [Ilumatobacteraceae bacterium]
MSGDAWITLVVLLLTFGVLIAERLPTSAAMGLAVFVLLLTDVVDQSEALSGLSSSAPATIAALYVLAGAATVTGALSPLVDRILGGSPTNGGNGMSSRVRLARLTTTTAAISAVLPNTPLVALMAPRVVTWTRRAGRSAATYLMPLSYAAVLGGVITVIGTSTNLVVSDLLRRYGEGPLSVFEITPVGLPVALVGVTILALVAPLLLRSRHVGDVEPAEQARRYTITMLVTPGGPLVGRTVEEAGLRHLRGVFLAGIERDGHLVTARPETRLGAGDACFFAGDVTDVVDLVEIDGLTLAEEAHLPGVGDQPDSALFEAVVGESSDLVGSTLKESGFRARYGAAVLAIRRHDDDLPGKLGTVELRSGDVLLVLATPTFSEQWGGHGDFAVIAPLDTSPPPRRAHAWVVLVAIVAMVGLAVFEVLDLLESALLAVVVLLGLRVISLGEARRAVNVNVVLTIAMSISLGVAVQTSGLAAELASLLSRLGDPFGDVGQLVAVLAATMLLTELLSNNAAAAVMFPVAVATAEQAGLDPRSMAIVVLIGASCSFLSPIGYQTNTMVYSLGGYRFADFTRLGAPLTLATLIVTPIVVPLTIGL